MKVQFILAIIWIILVLAFFVILVIFVIQSIVSRRKINKVRARAKELLFDYYKDHPEEHGTENYFKYINL